MYNVGPRSAEGVLKMGTSDDFLNNIDRTTFTIYGRAQRVEKPWGYELIFTTEDSAYTLKQMHIDAGKRMSLQIHDKKTETYTLLKGKATLLIENSAGELVEVELTSDKGYTTKVGQRHRLIGVTDCDILEASTPEVGTTVRLEDDYARPNETDAMRAKPDRGWSAGK
jgi:mannose-6-phosphate isomerase